MEEVVIKPTNLGKLKKLLREAADLTEQLETKIDEINEFEVELEPKS